MEETKQETAVGWFYDRLKWVNRDVYNEMSEQFNEAKYRENEQRTEDYKLGYRHGAGDTSLTNMIIDKNK